MSRRAVPKMDRAKGASRAAATKKQGAGGKGTWGRPGDEVGWVEKLDPNDPNYDSEEESGVLYETDVGEIVRSYGEDKKVDYAPASRRTQKPPDITLAQFKTKIITVLLEYFVSDDTDEVARCLNEIDAPVFHYEVVKRCITMAMDKAVRGREGASQLISSLYGGGVLTTGEIEKGFVRIFEVVDDLQIDIPDAPRLVSQFLARAVVDEVMPPSFLSDDFVAKIGGDIVDQAKVMLSRNHGVVRVQRVWGPGDGRPVTDLKSDIRLLLAEFLMTSDLAEATRCIKDLNVPLFHHEVVKRAVVLGVDAPEQGQDATSALLTHLMAEEIISPTQMEQGFERVYESLADLALDTPRAPQILHRFMQRAVRDGCLPASYARKKAQAASVNRTQGDD